MASISLNVPLRRKKQTTPVAPNFVPIEDDLKDLLPGEVTIAKATNVRQVVHFGERSSLLNWEVPGSLYCSNYRICFVPDVNRLPDSSGACMLEASKAVPLTCISQVNIVSSKSRKVVGSMTTLPKKLSQIQVVCKDVRKLFFNLKHSNKGEAFSLINAIARHAHPNSVNLLFAFDYARAIKNTSRDQLACVPDAPQVPSFLNARDWQRELLRLGITNDQWRVSEANKVFLVCGSLSPFFPCPTSFTNSGLENAASLHTNNRIPVWCWSHPRTGVSLTRGGALLVDDEGEAPDPNYRVSIAMARHTAEQVENKGIRQLNVHHRCGPLKGLLHAFNRMRDLCTPGSTADWQSMDRHWYGSVESSEWLRYVRACLILATEVTHLLCIKHMAVMLLEENKCDLSCVVSSLVQLMADAHYRTISGFETLIQKEWVALGHSFTTRHCLVVDPNADDRQEAPVLLIFLDCVWQLSRQFPSAFEFSELYLLRFYDMVLTSLYGNFLFDCPKHRLQASRYSRRSCFFGVGDEPLEVAEDYEGPLLSAWSHWREGISKEENERCLNPLFYIFGPGDGQCGSEDSAPLAQQFGSFLTESGSSDSKLYHHGDREVTPVSVASSYQAVDYYQKGLLVPETSMCSLQVWRGFFFRYLPDLGVADSGRSLSVQQLESRMVRDIQKLKEDLNELELSVGMTYTTDLPSCIGEVVQSREREMLADRRESVEVGVPLRPLLTASVYSYDGLGDLMAHHGIREGSEEDVDGSGNTSENPTPISSPPSTPSNPTISFNLPVNGNDPHRIPGAPAAVGGGAEAAALSGSTGNLSGSSSPRVKQTSLVQFTDALYNTEMETGSRLRTGGLDRAVSSGGIIAASRSPVTKTRVRVVRNQSNDPIVAAWQVSPRQSIKSRELSRQRSSEADKPPPVPIVLRSSEVTDL